MAISRETTERIRDLLKDHPRGLSITDIVRAIPINRNTASRYLDTMLVSGQVEMRHFGMARIFSLAKRLPVSSILSVSSEFVMQVDCGLRIVYINAPFLALMGLSEGSLLRKKIDTTRIPDIFEGEFARLLHWISDGLLGIERQGEFHLPGRGLTLACRLTPAVFSDGMRGVTILFEDITAKRHDEECLRESEEKFRTLAEAATDGILICNAEGIVLEWNEAMGVITGIRRERAVGSPLPDPLLRSLVGQEGTLGHPAVMRTRFKTAIRSGRIDDFFNHVDSEIARPDGTRRFIHNTIFPIRTSRATLVGAIVHDITGQRQMLAEISAREERFRALLNHTTDMITVHGFTPDGLPGTFIEVNDVGCRRLGYSREELLRMSPPDLIDPSCTGIMRENAERLRKEGSAVFEIVHVAKNGRKIPVEIRSRVFRYHNERLVIGQVRDLSDRKAAEAALARSEARFRSIIKAAPVGIGIVFNRVIREVNDRLCNITGYAESELVGMPARMLYLSDDDYSRVGAEIYRQIRARGHGTIETQWRHRSGAPVDVLISASSVAPGTSSEGITFTITDISERKRAETALRSSEERTRNLLQRSFDAVIIHKEGKIVVANDAALALAGAASPADLLGSDIGRFIHPDSRQIVRERITEMLSVPGTTMPLVREKLFRLNGETIEVEVMATSFLDDGVPAVQVVYREVTDTVRMEDLLKRSEEIYRTLAESAADVICVVDPDGRLIYANSAFATMIQCRREDLVGRKLEDLAPPEMARRHHENVRKVISTGIPCEHGEVFPTPTGEKQLDVKLSPVAGPDGNVVSVVVIARDITRRMAKKPEHPGGKNG